MKKVTFKSKDGHLFEYRTEEENCTCLELIKLAEKRLTELGYEMYNYVFLRFDK